MGMDLTEEVRRAMVEKMPDELVARIRVGERIWDTAQLQDEFEVIGFLAPFVVVRRISDGQQGTLMFNHAPRYYFGWSAS